MTGPPGRYLFVAGTPRAGTTATAELLSTHPDIALGIERYKRIYRDDIVGPEHFSAARFARFDDRATNITPDSPKHRDHYARVLAKFPKAQVVGDKYPRLYRRYGYLSRTFGAGARFLYIARAIEDVASSWNVRALDEADKWPRNNDYREAVAHWNDGNRRTLRAIGQGIPVLVIAYEWLFDRRLGRGEATIAAMLDHVGLAPSADLLARWRRDCDHYDASLKDKPKLELPGQAAFLAREADLGAYRRVLAIADRQLAAAAPANGAS